MITKWWCWFHTLMPAITGRVIKPCIWLSLCQQQSCWRVKYDVVVDVHTHVHKGQPNFSLVWSACVVCTSRPLVGNQWKRPVSFSPVIRHFSRVSYSWTNETSIDFPATLPDRFFFFTHTHSLTAERKRTHSRVYGERMEMDRKGELDEKKC